VRNLQSEQDESWLTFIPKSFLYELSYDFSYYWLHRLAHSSYFMFKHSGHYLHHKITDVAPFHGIFVDPREALVLNLGSSLFASLVLSNLGYTFTEKQLTLQLIYKRFIEYYGHAGSEVVAPSFIQFPVLPIMLGMEMYPLDHYQHHQLSKVNFSKRFTVFDQLFSTSRSLYN
jgi:sterol desaturase/sphingolipid hydroxylase (fatty acid hydroxylase superfamily)